MYSVNVVILCTNIIGMFAMLFYAYFRAMKTKKKNIVHNLVRVLRFS